MISEQIKKLLKLRDDFSLQTNTEILDLIPEVVLGIDDYFENRDLRPEGSEVVVSAIMFMEGLYTFVGHILPPMNAPVQLTTGEIVDVESKEVRYEMRKMFRVQLPEEILITNDQDTVFHFLSNNDGLNENIHKSKLSKYKTEDNEKDVLSNKQMIDILDNMDTEVMH